ncbi:MAG: hypothetical protein H8Z69_04805 [Nanohaloarchaea archaeon]|nr:hypothetical protein [Candidatus Nanohaloarchaea archaeon]
MRKKIVLVLLIIFIASSAAEVQYSIEADREKILMNTTVKLDCQEECPVSNWRLDWKIPENAEIIGINDSLGRIDSYTLSNDSVIVSTNKGRPRNSETLQIRMKINEEAEKIHEDWHRRELSLPSFKGEKTTGTVKVVDFISGWIDYGFLSSYKGSKMQFRGEGPTNIRLNFGKGNVTDYFNFFGSLPENADEAYTVAVGTIGQVQGFERFPAATLPSEKYNRTVNRWSAGEYVSGSIRLRKNLGESSLPVLSHEVVHGLNDRKLKWDGTKSSYFEEGTSEYAEFLMRKKLYNSGRIDIGPRSLFGEKEEYRSEIEGKNVIYSLESKGSRETLWQYYDQNMSFMKNWNPHNFADYRDFGYAYSELVMRNYVRDNGSIYELYEGMDFDSKVKSPEEKWEFFSKRMDMKPCNYNEREKFEKCLEKVNDFDYPVYTAKPEGSSSNLEIQKLSLPNRTQEVKRKTGLLQKIIQFFEGLLSDL